MKTDACPKLVLFLVTVLLMSPVLAQNATRQYQGYAMAGAVLQLRTSDGTYLITPYSEQIIETTFVPQGALPQPASHAVVLLPEPVRTVITDHGPTLELSTPGIAVSIEKSPFKISYRYRGHDLVAEKNGYVNDSRGESVDFTLDAREALYGAGARALGMNRRGYRLPLYNKAHYGYEEHSEQMNFAIPLVYSSKMYGLHFDNAATGFLDLDSKKDNTLTYETTGGRKTYQVIAAANWEELMAAYTSLSGHQPLPPRWILGNFASRFGYHSEKQARAIVDQFIAQQIPLDAIIFDLYWFGKEMKGTMGNLAFDQDNFPDPKQMIADFRAKGVKTVLITEPFVLKTSARWPEAVDKKVLATRHDGQPYIYDFYFGQTGLIDVFKPEAARWFWDIYKQYTAWGVAGWWGDLGEPEVHPADLVHQTGSAEQVHNIYGHNWARLIAQGYQKDFPRQRPFILMRAGYSGSQRYGLIPWSGDVNRSWGGLSSQPEIALQMGMQGLAYMHSDLGGFAGANEDDELYVRWLQYGVFQPVFRPHGQEEVAAEPVLKSPRTQALAKAAIELRYRLLPYNYTLAFDNSQKGLPLMRPLFFAEPDNTALYNVSDSYLWGPDFLIKPVLKPGLTASSVYFPATANWFDFYTDERFDAGSTVRVPVVAEHLPVFVRAGAFIPMIKVIQHTEELSAAALQIHYYDDASVRVAVGKYYADDGITPNAYEQGAYSMLLFESSHVGNRLSITVTPTAGAHYAATQSELTFLIHQVRLRPKQVTWQAGVRPAVVDFKWDAGTHILSVALPPDQTTAARLVVELSASSDE